MIARAKAALDAALTALQEWFLLLLLLLALADASREDAERALDAALDEAGE